MNTEAELIRNKVVDALSKLKSNKLGLHVAENGVHQVDGQWWVVLEPTQEPNSRSEVWDAIVEVEELLDEHAPPRVMVTAA